jgi:hypothetical protein
MSKEDYEKYRFIAEKRTQESSQRRTLNKEDFQIALQLANKAGIELIQKTEFHYQLKNHWLINVYPGNQRLYYDRNFPKPPFLNIKSDWNLIDVVKAAILASGDETKFSLDSVHPDEEIQSRAYQLWESAGCPENSSVEFWLQAEKEILG